MTLNQLFEDTITEMARRRRPKVRADKAKSEAPTINNFVAKNDVNKGGAHRDKTKYRRKEKHQSEYK